MTHHKISPRHMGGIYRGKKYKLKNVSDTTALLYKSQANNFRPTDIQLQTVQQNLDGSMTDLLNQIGLDLLNRKSALSIAQQLITIARTHSGQTLLNEYQILVSRYNIHPSIAKSLFDGIINIMQSEGLIPYFSFP